MNKKIAKIKSKLEENSDVIIGGILAGITAGVIGIIYINKVKMVAGCEILTEILDDFADGKKHLAWLDGGTFYVQPEPHIED